MGLLVLGRKTQRFISVMDDAFCTSAGGKALGAGRILISMWCGVFQNGFDAGAGLLHCNGVGVIQGMSMTDVNKLYSISMA